METETVEFTADELAVLKDEAVPEPKPEAKPAEVVAEKDPQPRTEEGKFDTPEGEPEKKLVTLSALHEERQRRKELQEEIRRNKEEQARRDAILEQRLAALQQARQTEQPKAPTWDDSPLDAGKATTQDVQELKAERQQAAFANQVVSAFQWDKAEFVRETADYTDAENFLIASRMQELAIYNPGVPQWQLRQFVDQEALQLAATHLQQRTSPAKAVYELAKARGYKRAEPKPQEPAKPTEAERLQVIERAQESATSLAAAGGAPAGGPLTLDMIAKMSDDEFAALTEKQFRKAMGA
jgi:HD-GYP domain-containing protein (c-di-GMP phosphodiesterase class II)